MRQVIYGGLLVLLTIFSGCGRHAGLEEPAEWDIAPWVYSVGVMHAEDPLGLREIADPSMPPVFAGDDCSDILALFAADPFLFHTNDTWYLFAEVWNIDTAQGDIALATSSDGVEWEYRGVVLDEPFHLSYPCVFAWNDNIYMVPESYRTGTIRLYRADPFPDNWVHVVDLVNGVYVDSTPFYHAGRWWMFAGVRSNLDLHLFWSDDLYSGWQEHPRSPVIRGDGRRARPGGRTFVDDDGRLIRIAQDCLPTYGNQVRAFEVTELTTDTYAERELANSPILDGTIFPWASAGMHHFDPQRVPGEPGRWLVAIDGHVIVQPEETLDIGFANGMALRGMTVLPQAVRPGENILLRFFWKGVSSPMPDPPVCFVHIRYNGQIIFQADYQTMQGREVYENLVRVPDDAPAGEYEIRIGLHWPERRRRARIHGDFWNSRRVVTIPAVFSVLVEE